MLVLVLNALFQDGFSGIAGVLLGLRPLNLQLVLFLGRFEFHVFLPTQVQLLLEI
jgi:hypothetical protein